MKKIAANKNYKIATNEQSSSVNTHILNTVIGGLKAFIIDEGYSLDAERPARGWQHYVAKTSKGKLYTR